MITNKYKSERFLFKKYMQGNRLISGSAHLPVSLRAVVN